VFPSGTGIETANLEEYTNDGINIETTKKINLSNYRPCKPVGL
jgi:hypothetical protein